MSAGMEEMIDNNAQESLLAFRGWINGLINEQEADDATFAHLSDVTVSRAEMNQIVAADAAWEHVSVRGGIGWHNTDTDEVVFASTPGGVPDNYVYVPPDEEVGDEYDVVESNRGATYRSPEPVSGDNTNGLEAVEALESDIQSTITFDNRSDIMRGDTDMRDAVFKGMVDAVESGAETDAVVQTVAERVDETASFSSIYSTNDVLNKIAREHFASDDETEREISQRLHARAESPDTFPDASVARDEDPFENDATELTDSLSSRMTPDTTYDMTSYRSEEGRETFAELESYVEDGGDPSQAVLALASAYDDNTLENLSPEEVNGKIADFGRNDDLPDTAAAGELAREFRKFNRDADDYPRELTDAQRTVMDELEAVVAEQDRTYSVDELSFTRLDLVGVDQTVADTINETGDVEPVVELIEDNITGDSRERFYHGVVSELGTRDTEYGEASLLSSSSRGVTSEASNDLTESFDDDESRQYYEARGSWQAEVYSEDTAPLFQMAAEQTGNNQVPTDDEDVFNVLSETPESVEEFEDMYESMVEHSRETVKDVYGDSVVAYRGLSPEGMPSATGSSSISDDLANASDAGESVELEHRTLESWSVDPLHAQKFSGVNDEEQRDGVIIKREIPTDRVMASSYSGVLNAAEDELAVAHDESDTYEPEQVMTPDEVREGKAITEMLRRAANFGDGSMEQEADENDETDNASTTPTTEPVMTVGVGELPAINWIDSDDEAE